MKSLLAKYAVRKALGVYVGEHEVVVTKLASTALGPVQMACVRESYVPEQLGEVLGKVLAPLVGPKRRFPIPVALGIAGQRVFFSTRPIKSTNAESSPEMLLHEAFRSSSISVDDMALDVIKVQSDKKLVASIASCRRKYLATLLSGLQTADVNPFRAEPAPCALLRVANSEHRAPRKVKTVLRIFLSGDQGLAILAVANLPYVWRYFALRSGEEANSILSSARTIFTLTKSCGIESPIEAIMIHGRAELRSQLNFEHLQDDLGIATTWHPGPALDDSVIAYGLAVGCLTQSTESFDLARSLKPRRSLWELFPWGETAMQGAFLACMGLFLAERSSSLNKSYAAVKKDISAHVWMDSVGESELQKEKKELEAKVEAIRKFMGTRVLWTSYTHDIPTRLPKNATINGFEGICDLAVTTKKKESAVKVKKSLLLRVGAPIKQDGAMPVEIDDFLKSLREHPLLKKDFPIIELVDLKWYQPFSGAEPLAIFTVMCMPKAAPAEAPPKTEEEKK